MQCCREPVPVSHATWHVWADWMRMVVGVPPQSEEEKERRGREAGQKAKGGVQVQFTASFSALARSVGSGSGC